MLEAGTRRRLIHWAFVAALALKGLDGLLELAAGMLLLLTSRPTILRWVLALTHEELAEDPSDFISNYLVHAARGFSARAKAFAVIYLLIQGLIKLGLVAGLLRRKLWVYPTALVILVGIIGYQLYRICGGFSPGLTLVTGLDIIVVILVCLEYRRLSRAGDGAEPGL